MYNPLKSLFGSLAKTTVEVYTLTLIEAEQAKLVPTHEDKLFPTYREELYPELLEVKDIWSRANKWHRSSHTTGKSAHKGRKAWCRKAGANHQFNLAPLSSEWDLEGDEW